MGEMALLRRALALGPHIALRDRTAAAAAATGAAGASASGGSDRGRGLVVDDASLHMPVVWTVRSKREGGAYAWHDNPSAYAWLVALGVRMGVDCIDVELGKCDTDTDTPPDSGYGAGASGYPASALLPVVRYAALSGCCIIASAHWPGLSAPPSGPTLAAATQQCLVACIAASGQAGRLSSPLPFSSSAYQCPPLSLHTCSSCTELPPFTVVPTVVKLIGSSAAPATATATASSSVSALPTGTSTPVPLPVPSDLSVADAWQAAIETHVAATIDAFAGALAASGCVGALRPAIISLLMGAHPSLSVTRATNQHLTPVTHPLLPIPAAPGQLSAAQIGSLRASLGLVPARQYCLFGHPIGASPSPSMHNTAFGATHLPHAYALCDTESAASAVDVLLQATPYTAVSTFTASTATASASASAADTRAGGPAVGGGSVTIPLKQTVVTEMTARARQASSAASVAASSTICVHPSADVLATGATNTVVTASTSAAGGNLSVSLHNTDWVGIARPLQARVQVREARASSAPSGSASASGKRQAVLVVGAGGTAIAAAYAVAKLGLALLVHNPRTPAKAGEIASPFHGLAVEELTPTTLGAVLGSSESLAGAQLACVISTLPASAAWTAPEWLYDTHASPSTPLIVFDVAYKPRTTPLLAQARTHASSHPGSVLIVEGVEMLIEQGALQHALWTGKGLHAPRLSTVPAAASACIGSDVVLTGVPVVAMADAAYWHLEGAPLPS